MSNNNIIEYTIGWICALPLELVAAEAMLDCRYADDSSGEYTLGRIGAHNVVIACLPAGLTGTNAAATVAARMMSKYPSIRFGLMVGIGGGVPSKEFDIRLGDVVVSQPRNGYGGVVQYDFGKSRPGEFELTGFLNTPPMVLLSALSKLQADHLAGKSKLSEYLHNAAYQLRFALNTAKTDVLFEASYDHVGGPTCEHCSEEKQIDRPSRDQQIVVHYGTIASGNQVMRDGKTRDRLSSELGGVLCFEMEAAGLMNSFPCLVIRGICDYADSHKNKIWQPFAAATAAAYAKEILVAMPGIEVFGTRIIDHVTKTEMLRGDIEIAIEALDLRRFLAMLPPVGQEKYNLDAPPLDRETPDYYWIFKNEDFRNWDTGDSSRILWLAGPPECNLRKAASSIIRHEMAQVSTILRVVLYFFCSAAVVEDSSISIFILAIVHQVILSSTEAIQRSIASTFLRGVLSDILKKLPPGQSLQFPPSGPNSHVRNLLGASDNSLWAALWAIMPTEHNLELAICISGIEHVRDNRIEFIRKIRQFVDDLQRTSKVKILLTSGLEKDTAKEFDGLPCIEYDKERTVPFQSILCQYTIGQDRKSV
ncbi:nucleoside phosphorylase domain-containing protein [Trichoderma velutinum]